jgi:hypothetical protein
MEKRLHIHRRPKGGECIDYDLNKLQRCIMFNGELWDICEHRVARYGSKPFVTYVLRKYHVLYSVKSWEIKQIHADCDLQQSVMNITQLSL